MYFFLTALKIAHVLNEEKAVALTNTDGEPTSKETLPKFAESTPKELWEDLDKKYKIEDASNKKFLVNCRKELKQKKDTMTMQELIKKADHFKKQCRVYLKEKQQKNQANMVDNDDLAAMISEAYTIGDDEEWWIDSGVTKHIAKNKNLFKIYVPIVDEQDLFMRNYSTAKVIGKGTVVLNLTSGKKLTLTNENIIVSKGGIYVGKGYASNGMYNDDVVAIKWIKNNPKNRENQRMIEREIHILSQMNHDNIVKFIGAAAHEACIIIVMEFMEGGALVDYLADDDKTVDLKKSIRFALDISKSTEYVHGKNILHQDLKTGNLALSKDKVTVKLLDLGLGEDEITEMNVKSGTTMYMAVESDLNYDLKTDIYSFSIILWELLTDQSPFGVYTGNLALSKDKMTVKLLDFGLGEDETTEKNVKSGTAMYMAPEDKRPSLKGIPEAIIPLLERCWETAPHTRPEFNEISKRLIEFFGII
ncbi:tyrosine-protein kinase Fer-like [Telopea speciosissima]|uniref:tyrosine-protein kinase Fer-like n=1 Tax=Telopea speciosissima TaxID=54955 RepID=UPI001CC4B60E|nr:tyrosine-protein kinase Fer-like [Telopea speciosissima]